MEIDPDIRRAHTLPAEFYRDARVLERLRERAFARSWQLLAEEPAPGHACPLTLLPGCLDEPVVLTRTPEGELHALSNVCTHRGNILQHAACPASSLRCGYHGRRFGLDGKFLSMPSFEGAEGFPSKEDDLPRLALGRFEKLLFASLAPPAPLEAVLAPVRERTRWMPWSRAVRDPRLARDYHVNANWALYCDNYLEGFHIPWVHPELAPTIDFSSYRTEVFEHASCQIGLAAPNEPAFEPPEGAPDHGLRVAAYWFLVFPNTMLNFYPWGVSINVVVPLAVDRTRISYSGYVWDPSKLGLGAGGALELVEQQDEAVVESVQRGVRSRLYRRGRFSPSQEAGVHHFHGLLARAVRD